MASPSTLVKSAVVVGLALILWVWQVIRAKRRKDS